MPRLAVVLLLLAPALGIASPAGSMTILDQESTLPGSPVSLLTDNDTVAYQDVVVGATGNLTAIEVQIADALGTTDDVCCVIRVYDGVFTTGVLTLLGTALHPFPGPPSSTVIAAGWIRLELSTPIAVTSGQAISFAFSHQNVVELSTGNYTPGLLTITCGLDPCPGVPFGGTGLDAFENLVLSDVDLAFRTFVSVPEPGAALLVGFLGLALVRSRRGRPVSV